MKQSCFSAQELICMAKLCGKKVIHGIPDGFAAISEEDMPVVFQQVYDVLIKKRIAELNFDGRMFLYDEYTELINICCDCDKCLTVNIQRTDHTASDYIFWHFHDTFHMAEVIEDSYVFSKIDAALIGPMISEPGFPCGNTVASSELVIPQTELLKAKRQCKGGSFDSAVRILRQNGADERLSHIIADGLGEKAAYIGLLYMDNREGGQTEKAYLSSQGAAFELSQTIVNFRTCAVFKEVDGTNVKREISALVDLFLDCQKEEERI